MIIYMIIYLLLLIGMNVAGYFFFKINNFKDLYAGGGWEGE